MAYEKYKSELDQGSQDYDNLLQLEASEITFVIAINDKGRGNEGSLGFDGLNVQVNVDPGGPSAKMSLGSRMAHEMQHAVQVDNGQIGFQKLGNEWVARFTDIQDEIGGWNAGVRQATPRDLARGPLARPGSLEIFVACGRRPRTAPWRCNSLMSPRSGR